MIVDKSALLAILLDEPGATALLDAVAASPNPRMSASSWLEVALVIEERGGKLAALRFDEFVRAARIEITPVDAGQAFAAREAWRHFGRHRHGTRLDMGDCLAYALAKTLGDGLLYTGQSFARTDIRAALGED